MDGRTDGRTDGHFPPSNIIRSTFGSRPNKGTFEINIMDTGVNTGVLDGGNVYGYTYNKVKQKQSAESGS